MDLPGPKRWRYPSDRREGSRLLMSLRTSLCPLHMVSGSAPHALSQTNRCREALQTEPNPSCRGDNGQCGVTFDRLPRSFCTIFFGRVTSISVDFTTSLVGALYDNRMEMNISRRAHGVYKGTQPSVNISLHKFNRFPVCLPPSLRLDTTSSPSPCLPHAPVPVLGHPHSNALLVLSTVSSTTAKARPGSTTQKQTHAESLA